MNTSELHREFKLHFWPYIQIQFSCFSKGVELLAGWERRSTGQSTMVLFCNCRCDVKISRFSGRIADVSFSFASEMRGTLQRNLSMAAKENWGLFTMFNLMSCGVPFFRDSNRSSFRFLHVERFNSVWSGGECELIEQVSVGLWFWSQPVKFGQSRWMWVIAKDWRRWRILKFGWLNSNVPSKCGLRTETSSSRKGHLLASCLKNYLISGIQVNDQ